MDFDTRILPTLADLIAQSGSVAGHRPWPRAVVGVEDWKRAAEHLAWGHWSLLDLFGDAESVHMALRDRADDYIAVVSLHCPDGRFPSIASHHPPAIRLERAIADLFGLEAEDAPDTRPWLDHGCWNATHFKAGRPSSNDTPASYAFLPTEGEHLHQIAVGPVHAGIIEPGHFRFTAAGETIVRLEARLGYVHKGIERLMVGADLERGCRLAGRVSGDSTVAYALAFARAVEAALDFESPPRAVWLRALLAELERLANHLGDIGAICNDAAFALMHAQCGVLRERVLRTNEAVFGHRLLRDCIVPGGIEKDLNAEHRTAIRDLLSGIARRFPALVELYDNTASLQDRTVGTGFLAPELASRFAAGGYIGRASGRDFDVRSRFGYPPYQQLRFEVPVLTDGDVNARVWIRIREVQQSFSLIEQLLAGLPEGPLKTEVPAVAGEGMALVEGFRGDVLAWLRLDERGHLQRCRLRDPSWFQWPLLEAAIEGNIVADFPLCNKSFNCSYSGHDL